MTPPSDTESCTGIGGNRAIPAHEFELGRILERRGFSLPFLVRVMCANPARTFGMPRKGTLEPGTDADVVLFDPDAPDTVDETENASNSTFSIYDGWDVSGSVKRTYVRGELVAADGEIVAEQGVGRFLERDLPDWED